MRADGANESKTQGPSRPTKQVLFQERLIPKWWVWLAITSVVGSVAVAYAYALGGTAGWAVFAAGMLVAAAGLLASAPKIIVTAASFRAGPATLPSEWIGKVSALDQTTSEAARTTQADPSAHLLLRTLAAPRVVIVEVTDPEDPHPYWLISTRRPAQLADALVKIRPSIQADASR
jgi:hypothetical protein